MSTPARPSLKSLPVTPIGPRAAAQAAPGPAGGESTGAARKGVQTGPGPQAGDSANPTPEQPGLRAYAPPIYCDHYDGARWSKRYGDTPTAAYACRCGQTETATGARVVAALLAKYDIHRDTCSPRSTEEGRAAA
ncbi:hypothetical protein ACFYMI_16995 [Streptomyces collinus]|uniref:hypothetical protein n=1 Tax=Streptomyces collinus TaxID=42684 RepID=UPI0036BCCDF5